MRREATVLGLFLLAVQTVLSLANPSPALAADGGGVLGHLYAGTRDPGVVYRYVEDNRWEAISPRPSSDWLDVARPELHQRRYTDVQAQTPLGEAVLDLVTFEGHLYAATVSQRGTGQVWRHDGGTHWTLVGDDLDDRVSSLHIYRGDLHAVTGVCGTRVYKFVGGHESGTALDWTAQPDGTAQYGGISEGHGHTRAEGLCVHDYAERYGDAYLATDVAIMHRAPEAADWRTLFTLGDGHPRELEILRGSLYTGYDSGQVRVFDGFNGPGELVFAAPQAITAMATDTRALYVGTGNGGGRRTPGGRIYRLDSEAGSAEPISGELGASIETLHVVAPSGLDLSELERGDVLLVRGPGVVEGAIGFVATWVGGSYWIHGGMYAGEGKVVESSSAVADDFGMVRIASITETLFWKEENYWAALRITEGSARDPATSYAEGQVGDLYNIDYPFWGLPVKRICEILGPIIGIDPAVCCAHPVTDRETEDDCFYCTHLPWRAYHTQGIDLDANAAWPARLFAPEAIPGDDIYYDDDVALVGQRKGMRAVVIRAVGSAADMLVIDPQGRRTGFDPDTGEILDEIPEITYGRVELPAVLDFFLPDKWSSDFVAIPNLDETWEIRITGTKQGDYALGAELVDWQHHRTQTITRTTVAGQIDTFKVEYPAQPGGLIIRTTEVYLPLVVRGG